MLSEPTIGGGTDASEDGVKRGEGWKQARNMDAGAATDDGGEIARKKRSSAHVW